MIFDPAPINPQQPRPTPMGWGEYDAILAHPAQLALLLADEAAYGWHDVSTAWAEYSVSDWQLLYVQSDAIMAAVMAVRYHAGYSFSGGYEAVETARYEAARAARLSARMALLRHRAAQLGVSI